MSAGAVTTILVASACYAVASVLRVDLSNGRRVIGVAAFGPPVIALGPHGHDVASIWVLLGVATLAQALAMGVRRSGWRDLLGTSVLLAGSATAFVGLAHLFSDGSLNGSAPGPLLVVTVVATAPYAVADLFVRSGSLRSSGNLRAELRWGMPLYLVLGSTAGLAVFAFGPLGWPSFPLLLLALLVTWHEFRRFAEATRTYEQTVCAMGSLTERAGYAPKGYHERVSELAAAVGRELGLSWDRVRALRLVGHVQRVGAVSLSEPGQLDLVDSSYVDESGRRILEETGQLAPFAHFLSPGGSSPVIEAEILRAVSGFVQSEYSSSNPVASLDARGGVKAEVLQALVRCVGTRSSARA